MEERRQGDGVGDFSRQDQGQTRVPGPFQRRSVLSLADDKKNRPVLMGGMPLGRVNKGDGLCGKGAPLFGIEATDEQEDGRLPKSQSLSFPGRAVLDVRNVAGENGGGSQGVVKDEDPVLGDPRFPAIASPTFRIAGEETDQGDRSGNVPSPPSGGAREFGVP
jgi:hypothetical protein